MLLTFENGTKNLDTAIIVDMAHFKGECLIFASGTLVEGIGNYQSDLDVYVLCDELNTYGEIKNFGHSMCQNSEMMHCQRDDEYVRRTLDYFPGSPTHCEIEYWTHGEVEKLLDKINRRFDYVANQADVTSHSPFSSGEQKLVHRAIVGRSLDTGRVLGDEIFNLEVQEKYSFLNFRRFGLFFWIFKDVLGAIQSANDLYIHEVSRNYLIHQIIALYTLYGGTNPNLRWFPVYLQRFGSNKKYSDLTKTAIELLYGDFNSSKQRLSLSIFDVSAAGLHCRIDARQAKQLEDNAVL